MGKGNPAVDQSSHELIGGGVFNAALVTDKMEPDFLVRHLQK
jgi:hypothetical protein